LRLYWAVKNIDKSIEQEFLCCKNIAWLSIRNNPCLFIAVSFSLKILRNNDGQAFFLSADKKEGERTGSFFIDYLFFYEIYVKIIRKN